MTLRRPVASRAHSSWPKDLIAAASAAFSSADRLSMYPAPGVGSAVSSRRPHSPAEGPGMRAGGAFPKGLSLSGEEPRVL
jgi:hypothetical protein